MDEPKSKDQIFLSEPENDVFPIKTSIGAFKKRRETSNRAEMLLKMIKDPDSIVLIRPPRKTLHHVITLNRLFARAINAFLSKKLTREEIKNLETQIHTLAITSWNKLGTVYSFANENNLEAWRNFNENHEQKEAIIRQNINTDIYVAIPNSNVIGMLFTVIKHMCIARKKLRWQVDLRLAEVLSDIAELITGEIKKVIEDLNKKL